jgi:[ribosomal protein S18]-alanine N-acetyltransferase
MIAELRPARAEDLPACAAMIAASTPWRELGLTRERCDRIVGSEPGAICVALDADATVCGFLCLQPRGFIGQPYVKLLCVAGAARGHGIGRRLMEWAEAEAFERLAARNLFLLVTDFNEPARAFYTRLGFIEVGRIPDCSSPGATEIILRKTRGPLLERKGKRQKAKGKGQK